MFRSTTIRFKLTLWYAAVMGLVLVFFSTALYMTMARALYAEVDAKIKVMAQVTVSSIPKLSGHFDLTQLDRMMDEKLGFKIPGKFIQILDNTGTVGQTSANLQTHPLPISIDALMKASYRQIYYDTVLLKNSKYPIRMITYPIIENNEVTNILQIGTSLQNVQETLHKLLLTLLFGVPASLALASIGGWFMARKSLRPVNDITTAARRITAKNMGEKIEVTNPKDEVGRLAETFNDMIFRLNNSFRQVSQFTSNASHELRTPLTILRGEMEVALRSRRTSEEYKEVITSGLEEVEKLSQMVEELLLLSKADHGELRLNISDVSLHNLLESMYDNARILASGKGIAITTHIGEQVYIQGDEMRLRQLLLNLIDNAIKYTPYGGKVALSLGKDREYAYITVKDTGVGIAKEDHGRIFERFYRVDKSRSREIDGTGLGLAICKWITDAHGGFISVASEINKGSTFTVTLPLHHSSLV